MTTTTMMTTTTDSNAKVENAGSEYCTTE